MLRQAEYRAELGERLGVLIGWVETNRAAVGGHLNSSSARGAWTIGQIFEHMILGLAPYLVSIERALSTAPRDGGEVRHTWFGRMVIRAAGPEGKMPAPRKLRPVEQSYSGEIVDRWLLEHRRLQDLIAAAAEVDWSATRLRNPILGLMRQNLADSFEIVVAHAERHVGQIQTRLTIDN